MGITLRDEHDWFMQQLFTEVLMGMAPRGRVFTPARGLQPSHPLPQ